MKATFISLPLELRRNVYAHLMDTARTGLVLQPRLSSVPTLRPDHLIGLRDYSLGDCLSFLQTCQLIYAELTTMLYGEHTFYFDDDPNWYQEDKFINVDVSPYCRLCRRYQQRIERGVERNKNNIDELDRCWRTDLEGCHTRRLWLEDLVRLKDWLETIGDRNRSMIRQVHLQFTFTTYTRFPSTKFLINTANSLDTVGGEFVEQALKLLATTGRLRVLKLSFEQQPSQKTWMRDVVREEHQLQRQKVFWDVFKPGRMKHALCRFRGLTTFQCDDVPDMTFVHIGSPTLNDKMPLARSGVEDVRAQVLLPRRSSSKMETRSPEWSMPCSYQGVITGEEDEETKEQVHGLELSEEQGFAKM